MAIPDADPRAQELDQAFATALSTPAKPRSEPTAPPEIDPEAPHGRDESGEPLAPYGRTKDGKIKRSAGGRPRKGDNDRARTGNVTELRPGDEKDKAEKAKPDPRDWSPELTGLADVAWLGLSAVGKFAGQVPILGKLLPGDKIAAQAFVLSETKSQLIGAVNLAAQHNAKAAAFCAKLEGGDGMWALSAMFMVMPVVSISLDIWKGHTVEAGDGRQVTAAEMAKLNGDRMDATLKRIQVEIAAQAAAAQAAVQPEQAEPAMAAAG